jgi:hypothetical protein
MITPALTSVASSVTMATMRYGTGMAGETAASHSRHSATATAIKSVTSPYRVRLALDRSLISMTLAWQAGSPQSQRTLVVSVSRRTSRPSQTLEHARHRNVPRGMAIAT